MNESSTNAIDAALSLLQRNDVKDAERVSWEKAMERWKVPIGSNDDSIILCSFSITFGSESACFLVVHNITDDPSYAIP